jgi:hypothetical protein
MENTSNEAPQKKSSTASIVVIVGALLAFVVLAPGCYEVYLEEQHNREIAKNMLSAANAARAAINAHVGGPVLWPDRENTRRFRRPR